MANRIVWIIVFLNLCFQICLAQENNREIGIRFNELNTFSVIYKKQVRKNLYNRHRGAFSNISLVNEPANKIYRANFSYTLGRELRTEIKKPFYFISGFEAFMNDSHTYTIRFRDGDKQTTFTNRLSVGIGLVFGFQYNFSERIYVNLEAIPTFLKSYRINKSGNNNPIVISESPITFQVNNRRLFFLTLAYRFYYESKKDKEKKNKNKRNKENN